MNLLIIGKVLFIMAYIRPLETILAKKTNELSYVSFGFLGCQLYSTATHRRPKKGIRIYTIDFKTTPIEALLIEVNGPSLELRRNELGS